MPLHATSINSFGADTHTYRICGIIGELNIWRFTLEMQLARFLFGDFEYCMERNPCLQPKWCTFNLAIFM